MTDSVHVSCPHCGATNRLPHERLADRPNCGKCKQPLFTGYPVELSGGSFSTMLNQTDVPVVVDFWAPWCGPCKMMAPQFEQAARLLEPHARLAKVNTDEEQSIAAQFGIRSIPTVIMFKGGKEVARQSGAMNAASLVRWVQSAG